MHKFRIVLLLAMAALFTACGPSEDKIIEAQTKYRELAATHNQVVEAYAVIEDNSLDSELNTLYKKIEQIKSYNLYDMTEEEINVLIKAMDSIDESYRNYLKTIGEIKKNEDSQILVPYTFGIVNGTDITFGGLSLMEKGDTDLVTDVLESMSGFCPGQEMTGLTVYMDVDRTPWILLLTSFSDDENEEIQGQTYRLVLDEETLLNHPSSMTIVLNEDNTLSIE